MSYDIWSILALIVVARFASLWGHFVRSMLVDKTASEPLLEVSLMEGYQLTMQICEGGRVELCKANTACSDTLR